MDPPPEEDCAGGGTDMALVAGRSGCGVVVIKMVRGDPLDAMTVVVTTVGS